MTARHVLVLGGTRAARELASALHGAGLRVTTSLAGRLDEVPDLAGEVRVGGFGGADGLAAWIARAGVDRVVDATHPFAARMSTAAVAGCARAGVGLLALEPPGWTAGRGDRWERVADLDAAAARIAGGRVLLTTGRQDVAAFAAVDAAWFLVRAITPPDPPLPAHHRVLLARGPFGLAGERELLAEERIDLVVTKDAGGPRAAKLDAARELEVPVLVVDRPEVPARATVATVAEALAWVRA